MTTYRMAITNTARRIRNKANPPDFTIFTAASVLAAAFAMIPEDVANDLVRVPLDEAPRVDDETIEVGPC